MSTLIPSGNPPDPAFAADPKPEPPFEPPLEACCGNGCAPCIFDTYADQLRQYRAALKAWEKRQG